MAQRPAVADLITWLTVNGTAAGDATDGDGSPLDTVFTAARDRIEKRTRRKLPDDALDEGSTSYPSQVRYAVLLQASHWWTRRRTPEGVQGFGDLGVVRVVAFDPDVEEALSDFLGLEGFA